jgi:hypothetical protein
MDPLPLEPDDLGFVFGPEVGRKGPKGDAEEALTEAGGSDVHSRHESTLPDPVGKEVVAPCQKNHAFQAFCFGPSHFPAEGGDPEEATVAPTGLRSLRKDASLHHGPEPTVEVRRLDGAGPGFLSFDLLRDRVSVRLPLKEDKEDLELQRMHGQVVEYRGRSSSSHGNLAIELSIR